MVILSNITALAKRLGIADPSTDRTELIRQTQTYEGFSPCFKTKSTCGETTCSWAKECLKNGK
jgi:hypothetical protein